MLITGTLGMACEGRAYYVGGTDPHTLLPCTHRLALERCYHLIELSPKAELVRGWEAITLIRGSLETGALASKEQHAIKRWIDSQTTPARKLRAEQIITDAITLLSGRRLEEAEQAYEARYIHQLADPESLAALAWLEVENERPERVYLLDDGVPPITHLIITTITTFLSLSRLPISCLMAS